MNKREWVNACAKRLHKLQGISYSEALTAAAQAAREQGDQFGHVNSWESPVDVAERIAAAEPL